MTMPGDRLRRFLPKLVIASAAFGVLTTIVLAGVPLLELFDRGQRVQSSDA